MNWIRLLISYTKADNVDDIVIQCERLSIDSNYALHRWYNYYTSIVCERIFAEFGAIPERDYRNKYVDFYIEGEPFDLKLTVYPKKLNNRPYDLNTRYGKNEMIKWLYLNQSQEGRKHLHIRLFIVCDGKDSSSNMALKSDFQLIRPQIKSFLMECQDSKFNELIIEDNSGKYNVKSDIIYIAK